MFANSVLEVEFLQCRLWRTLVLFSRLCSLVSSGPLSSIACLLIHMWGTVVCKATVASPTHVMCSCLTAADVWDADIIISGRIFKNIETPKQVKTPLVLGLLLFSFHTICSHQLYPSQHHFFLYFLKIPAAVGRAASFHWASNSLSTEV